MREKKYRMKRIRIGNDLDILISIYNNGNAYDLTDKGVKLYLLTPVSRIDTRCTVISNIIKVHFSGENQKICGKYNIEIEIISGNSKNTLDSCDGFKLVDQSFKTGGEDGDFHVSSLNFTLNV